MKNLDNFNEFNDSLNESLNEAKFNAKKLAKEIEKEYEHLVSELRHDVKDNTVEFTWWGGDDGVEVWVDCDQQAVFLDDDETGEWNQTIDDFGADGVMDALSDWNSYN